MQLHYRRFGDGPPLIILHGLLGLLDNWKTVANKLAEHFEVFLVDQRNHGRSPHADSHTYPDMVNDLQEFIEEHELNEVNILGHSMGGKTAMLFALQHQSAVAKLLVVDIAPKHYPVHPDQIMEGLHAVDLSRIKTRQEADEVLSEFISEIRLRQWLLKNLLMVSKTEFRWRFNLRAITANLQEMGMDISNGCFDKPTLFVSGELSDSVQPTDLTQINRLFPQATIQVVPGAGHWVHADQPELFIEAALPFLSER